MRYGYPEEEISPLADQLVSLCIGYCFCMCGNESTSGFTHLDILTTLIYYLFVCFFCAYVKRRAYVHGSE